MKIFASWIFSPLLAGLFSAVFYKILKMLLNYAKIHLLKWDFYNRAGLIIVGAFGSYSLGANNVANVMGVFVPIIPFKPLDFGFILLTSAEQLCIFGGIAIAVGVFTYSQKIMETVGKNLFKLNPEAALVTVLSTAIVMFLFSSEWLEGILIHYNLPTIPLVTVSSTKAIIGSIIGIGLLNGGKGLNFKMLGKIASGWVTTPIISFIISFIALFFFQNVFQQRVYTPVPYAVTAEVAVKLADKGIDSSIIEKIQNRS
jgi:PiT family inorganic phosphate transporter